jgi:general secretion pathway protein G
MKAQKIRRGFTLLELMLVVAIIGVLVAIAAVNLGGQGERAKRRATWASMRVIKQAIDSYHLNTSSYPPTLQALTTGTMAYLDDSQPLEDGWKRPFLYSPNGQNGRPYDLISKGADGMYPSADDVDIWKPESE